jgi:hypothetical protein
VAAIMMQAKAKKLAASQKVKELKESVDIKNSELIHNILSIKGLSLLQYSFFLNSN